MAASQAAEPGGELQGVSPTCFTIPFPKTCSWTLSVENDARAKRLALVQEIQHHPLSGKVLHVDFHEVAETKKSPCMSRWKRPAKRPA
jgi:hypothetical protein